MLRAFGGSFNVAAAARGCIALSCAEECRGRSRRCSAARAEPADVYTRGYARNPIVIRLLVNYVTSRITLRVLARDALGPCTRGACVFFHAACVHRVDAGLQCVAQREKNRREPEKSDYANRALRCYRL